MHDVGRWSTYYPICPAQVLGRGPVKASASILRRNQKVFLQCVTNNLPSKVAAAYYQEESILTWFLSYGAILMKAPFNRPSHKCF